MFKEPFSHVYIEEDVLEDVLAKEITGKLKRAQIVVIKHYKDVFNRKNQHLDSQKKSPKLILAKKRPPFIYEGSALIQNFGYKKYLYAPIVQNCVYDCQYCLLQGMYENGNILIFTNFEDYFTEAKKVIGDEAVHLSISYDTDLLALEKLHGLSARWIEFIRSSQNIEMELRTKSANYAALNGIQPAKNVILSWSLLPQRFVEKYDTLTPALEKRIKDVKKAMEEGWNMRICIDPLIYDKEYEKLYGDFLDRLANQIDLTKIHSIALGAFRMNSTYLKKIQKQGRMSDILYYPYEVQDGACRYEKEKEAALISFVNERLSSFVKKEKIFIA